MYSTSFVDCNVFSCIDCSQINLSLHCRELFFSESLIICLINKNVYKAHTVCLPSKDILLHGTKDTAINKVSTTQQ